MGFGRLDWGNWLYGIFSGLIGGGAGAVVSGVTVSVVDSKDWALGSRHFFELVGMLFITHGAISAFMFLKQQPLPTLTRREVAAVQKLADAQTDAQCAEDTATAKAKAKEAGK